MNPTIYIREANKTDANNIASYYQTLSKNSKQMFAPHDFSVDCLSDQILANDQYYLKHGFKLMGHFDYEGSNYDMGLMII